MISNETIDSLREASASYQNAEPFPHIVVDDFFLHEVYQDIIKTFPSPAEQIWDRYDYKYQVKLACNAIEKMPAGIARVLNYLNSAPFLQILESLTGEKGLISDPYLVGGGLHQIESGGWLAVHADFTEPSHLKLFRRLNLLVYLNDDWDPSYGGDLELWDRKMSKCVKSVSPVANRCVVFTTTPTSFHGHPKPLVCPKSVTRKSIAIYYYVLERPRETAGILTRWQQSGGKDATSFGFLRRGLARGLWWLSYKLGGVAGRLDI